MCVCGGGGGSGSRGSKSCRRLQARFAGVCGCRCGEKIVWAERSAPDSFWVPDHRLNSATGEQREIIQTNIDSEPPD